MSLFWLVPLFQSLADAALSDRFNLLDIGPYYLLWIVFALVVVLIPLLMGMLAIIGANRPKMAKPLIITGAIIGAFGLFQLAKSAQNLISSIAIASIGGFSTSSQSLFFSLSIPLAIDALLFFCYVIIIIGAVKNSSMTAVKH